MPLYRYSKWLTGSQRYGANNLQLGMWLAFVAGAINAGGFFIVSAYTSHMTGLVSSAADNLVLGNVSVVLTALFAVLTFFAGALVCSIVVSFLRRRSKESCYAFPVFLEALLLLVFVIFGSYSSSDNLLLFLLCFVMGLQNALITKVSGSVVRTTHVTGMITDLGIELGKLMYWNRSGEQRGRRVQADRAKLRALLSLTGLFFLGGVAGALGFSLIGVEISLILSCILFSISLAPVLDDFVGLSA